MLCFFGLQARVAFASLVIAFVSNGWLVAAETPQDFAGMWRQINERCVPQPKNTAATYAMQIAVHDKVLQVHVISSSGHGEKKLDLAYEIGGKELVYTGTDGDEFHAKVQWVDNHFLFTVVEHERGRDLSFTETWTLIDSGTTLERVKSSAGKEVIYIFQRH